MEIFVETGSEYLEEMPSYSMITRQLTDNIDTSRMESQAKKMRKVRSDKAYFHLVNIHLYIQREVLIFIRM